jgi:hypothetical protein
MKLPLASHFVHPQRGTSIAFGSDKPGYDNNHSVLLIICSYNKYMYFYERNPN